MKTLIIYELIPEETKFFVVEGDRSDLDGCIVNSTADKKFSDKIRDEVSSALWGEELKTPLMISEPHRVVHCGFML